MAYLLFKRGSGYESNTITKTVNRSNQVDVLESYTNNLVNGKSNYIEKAFYDIVDDNTQKCYWTVDVQNFSVAKNSGITSIPLPDDQSDRNLLVKMFGETEIIKISFTVNESAVDRSRNFSWTDSGHTTWAAIDSGFGSTGSTNPAWRDAISASQKVSTLQQIDWLNETFLNADITDKVALWIVQDESPSNKIPKLVSYTAEGVTSAGSSTLTTVTKYFTRKGLFTNMDISWIPGTDVANVTMEFETGNNIG